MARIRGGWNASLDGAVPVRHFWQRDHEPTGDDLLLTMDREALATLAAELAAVQDEWDERGRS